MISLNLKTNNVLINFRGINIDYNQQKTDRTSEGKQIKMIENIGNTSDEN